MVRKFAPLFLTLLVSLLSPVFLSAHPHVFIDAKVTFQFSETEMEGFWVEWHFDPMFTSMVVMDFGVPREGAFSQNLIREIQDGAFSNLRHYDYFIYVLVDDQIHPTERVQDFTAFLRDRRLVYHFFVPFRHPIDDQTQTVRVRMYDDTFFTDIAFVPEHAVSVRSPVSLVEERRVYKNQNLTIEYDNRNQSVRRDGAVYSGLTHPWEVHLQYRLPNGR